MVDPVLDCVLTGTGVPLNERPEPLDLTASHVISEFPAVDASLRATNDGALFLRLRSGETSPVLRSSDGRLHVKTCDGELLAVTSYIEVLRSSGAAPRGLGGLRTTRLALNGRLGA